MRATRLARLVFPCALAAVAAVAADIPLKNSLGIPISGVYAMAPGHDPWEIAGAVEKDASTRVNSEALRTSLRIVVKLTDAAAIQFFCSGYLESSDELDIRLEPVRKGSPDLVPRLYVREGEGTCVAAAGYPFNLLLDSMEAGLIDTRMMEFLDPLDLFQTSGVFAIALANASWDIPVAGADFNDERTLESIRLETAFVGETVVELIFELHSCRFTPLTLELFGHKTYAFTEEAAQTVAGAELEAGQADKEEAWDRLVTRLTEVDLEELADVDPVMRFTFENLIFEGEASFDFSETTAMLHIAQKKPEYTVHGPEL
ncbi:MAG: hypothetical protein LBJ46_07525 [Planctomycetota bacterium]|jgi:hypothetical protein|nr:hypothetical protein [Planctomycetota bacterium]